MYNFPSNKAKTLKVNKKELPSSLPRKKANLSIWLTAERITRNFACIALLVITVYAVKEARLPDGKLIYTAANSVIDIPWEETLGRIQFVNAAAYETKEEFITYYGMPDLFTPSDISVMHTWTEEEPFLSFQSASAFTLAAGKVENIERQSDGSISVTMIHDNNYTSTYHCLSSCKVEEGESLEAMQMIGPTSEGEMVFVLKYDGFPIDPDLNSFEYHQS